MMKKVSVLLLMALVLFSCGTKQQKENQEATNKSTAVSVDKILSNTNAFVDKEVVVEGLVNHVCSHSGKRMFILGNNPDEALRITPNDKIGVFDKELEGNTVEIKGVLKELIINDEYVAQLEKEISEGMDNEALHDHSGGGHEEEESAVDSSKIKQVEQMKADIAESEKGFVAQYWIEASKVEIKECEQEEAKTDSCCDEENKSDEH